MGKFELSKEPEDAKCLTPDKDGFDGDCGNCPMEIQRKCKVGIAYLVNVDGTLSEWTD